MHSSAWSVVNTIIMQRAVDQDQTSYNRKGKSHEKRKRVKKTTEAEKDASSESDCENLYQTARHVLHRAQKLRSGSTPDTVLIRIGDIEVHVERQRSKCEGDGRVPIQSPKTLIKGNRRTRSKQRHIEDSPI